MWMKSIAPSRAAEMTTTRPRWNAMKPSTSTEPHRVKSMMSALIVMTARPSDTSGHIRNVRARRPKPDRQRNDGPPHREIGTQDRQFPRDRAAVADQGPTHPHGDG